MKDYTDLTAEMIDRFNRSGPRYTSYPTVPMWQTGNYAEDYYNHLSIEGENDNPISLYIHLPFCSRLCTFCGCNQFITTNEELLNNYLDVIEEELKQTAQYFGRRKRIQQLHFGGGTPTHLSAEKLQFLYERIEHYFEFDSNAEKAIEVHPRVTTDEQLELLYNLGFRRISLGVQDLDPQVQHAINRGQTLEQTQRTFNKARQLGFSSINLDLVYGLPCQTVETFQKTMEIVNDLRPERLAVYSFAYIPNMFKTHDRAIKEKDLPATEEKIAIYVESIRFFTKVGYRMIGMDHYALKNDELSLAYDQRTLHRNFMGYTTLKGLSQIGVGVSAISDFGNGYYQKEKNLDSYMNGVLSGQIPTIRQKKLNFDDLLRREVIETLMCQCYLSIPQIEAKYDITFKQYFAQEWQVLQSYEAEELVHLNQNSIKLSLLGILFMRNIVMPFDGYLKGKSRESHFSKTI